MGSMSSPFHPDRTSGALTAKRLKSADSVEITIFDPFERKIDSLTDPLGQESFIEVGVSILSLLQRCRRQRFSTLSAISGSSNHLRATSAYPPTGDIRWPMSVIVPISSALPLKADVAAVGRESPKLTHSRHL